METFYYNLSGGINQSTTKTELGLNTKNIYWADSQNVEIFQNKGIIRQKGNVLKAQIPTEEEITALHQLKHRNNYKLLIATKTGKLYIFDEKSKQITLINKTLNAQEITFTDFLNGTLVSSNLDKMFFVKNNDENEIIDCELKDGNNEDVYSNIVAIYKGRVWVAKGSTIYFSALGSYTDFTTENDAGYIKDFHTNTDDIVALKAYKDYLAIYKEKSVYLLSGTSPSDFAITQFADKGSYSAKSIVNVNNKQYFFTSGIYTLEVGELNQITLGSEITTKIKEEFKKFDRSRTNKIIALNHETKNQVWYFIPYVNSKYFHTIWINDILNKAWYKRVLPQNITSACVFKDSIYTSDDKGNIYQEEIGNTFNGKAIEFSWKSPFLSLGDPTVRKTIDEFYFILDESYENKFNFSVFKNYDSENQDDKEEIYSSNFENLVWHKENSITPSNDTWPNDNDEAIWAIDAESMYKAEISEANYAIQLCVEGNSEEHNAAIIGIEFKEVFKED